MLRPCLKHGVSIDQCAVCWPGFLQNLGAVSFQMYLEKRKQKYRVLGEKK